MSIASITCHIHELHLFINNLTCKLNIIGISECGLVRNKPSLTNIDLPNFIFEFIATESTKGGKIIYIHKSQRYKLRKDLNIYKPKAIESTFIEAINDNKLITIIGCIYKDSKTTVNEFTNDFILPLLEKLSPKKENANV